MDRFLNRLFGKRPEVAATRRAPKGEPAGETFEPKVLAIVYNPVMDQGATLIQRKGWNNVDRLIQGFTADVAEVSGGQVHYRVVDRQDVNDFPVKADGFRYTAKSYADVTGGRAPAHNPDGVDYHAIVDQFHLLERVGSGELDEVWMFGFPFAGFFESRMAGRGAFWCNAPPLENTDACPRRFVMMGFSFERGVGEMLEDLGHRAESVMTKVYEGRQGNANLWQRFTRYDKVAPGKAEIGSVHYAPNSLRDYDWGNPRFVPSGCDHWLNFPDLSGEPRSVNCAEWGNGDIRLHHRWWLGHIPKFAGDTNGVSNNWWRYFIRVDDPYFDA